MRHREAIVQAMMPRVLVVALLAGGQGSMAFFVWLRSSSPEPNVVVLVFALATLTNAILSGALAYRYRSSAMALTAVGWLIVTVGFALFALGGSGQALLWCANALQMVLLLLAFRYCHIAGVDRSRLRNPAT